MGLIKSISYSNTEILTNIKTLFLDDWFELDPTYSKGNFYKEIPQPKLKFDLDPQTDDTIQADCRNLPLENNSISSIVFDPPFMFGGKNGPHGGQGKDLMAKRFGMFYNFVELCAVYHDSLAEFYRILKRKGILAFKCQDYTDSKTTMTHCLVYNWAIGLGFYAKDLFILCAKQRPIFRPNATQRHARKFHSYWWVFQK